MILAISSSSLPTHLLPPRLSQAGRAGERRKGRAVSSMAGRVRCGEQAWPTRAGATECCRRKRARPMRASRNSRGGPARSNMAGRVRRGQASVAERAGQHGRHERGRSGRAGAAEHVRRGLASDRGRCERAARPGGASVGERARPSSERGGRNRRFLPNANFGTALRY